MFLFFNILSTVRLRVPLNRKELVEDALETRFTTNIFFNSRNTEEMTHNQGRL